MALKDFEFVEDGGLYNDASPIQLAAAPGSSVQVVGSLIATLEQAHLQGGLS